MNTLKLTKPFMVNGEECSELPYDFDNLTAKDKIEASKAMKANQIPMTVAEIDTDNHFFLFAQAVTKANPAITVEDLMRMSAKDAHRGSALARGFFYLNLEN